MQDLVYICMNQELECRQTDHGKLLELFLAIFTDHGNPDISRLRMPHPEPTGILTHGNML